jgi:hypothetical protein
LLLHALKRNQVWAGVPTFNDRFAHSSAAGGDYLSSYLKQRSHTGERADAGRDPTHDIGRRAAELAPDVVGVSAPRRTRSSTCGGR